MPLIHAHETTSHSIGSIRFTGLAAPSKGSIDNSVWRISVAPGTAAHGTHQVTREEVFVALSGSADISLGGRALTLAAGATLVLPADTDFSLANSGDIPFEAVVVLPVGGQAVLPGQAPFVPPWAL